jgi:hypothetical protein
MPSTSSSRPAHPASPRTPRRLGLPFAAILGLALLAVPRVVLHDLGLSPGTLGNAALALVPPLIWVLVALRRRVPNPFLTLLVVGLWYGILLALAHQLLWGVNFGDAPPSLGGNLAGVDPAMQGIILRVFTVGSSLVTGTVVGAVAGLVAHGFRAMTRRRG